MTSLTQLFVVTATLGTALSLISIWAPRRLVLKGTALATSVLFLPVSYAALLDLLSKPKPVDLEWWQGYAAEAEVLAARQIENEAIYLWLHLPDVSEPRAYVMPWDRASAEQLQEAMREAERKAGGVQMRLPFEPSLDDGAPRFYARPQLGAAAQGPGPAPSGVLSAPWSRRLIAAPSRRSDRMTEIPAMHGRSNVEPTRAPGDSRFNAHTDRIRLRSSVSIRS
jgi:hypothetical protein